MKTRLAARVAALVLVGAMASAACSSNDKTDSSSDTTTGDGGSVKGLTIDYSKLTGTLTAGGSSFQNAFQETARGAFQGVASGLTVNYDGQQGSGGGKNLLIQKTYDFAGSDSLLSADEKTKLNGAETLYFPVVVAPLAIVFHVSGVTALSLSADTLAGIFERKITKWDDAAIKAENSSATLPSADITVVRRDSGSGSTNNLTGFLQKAAPTVWTLGRGDTVVWPDGTQPAKGSSGVAQLVSTTNNAIGYVDFADAKNTAGVSMAKIKNAAGKYIAPSLDGVSKALDTTTIAADLTFDPLNASGAAAYPIATPTFIIVYKNQTDKTKGNDLKAYLNFIYTDGQDLAAQANYTKLPNEFRTKAIAQLSQLIIPS